MSITEVKQEKIRNIAIIAHVDHGKTTLIDAFIKQNHIFRQNQQEMTEEQILDKNELEKERGITITAKNISIPYKTYKINIIDTPGHADFGGEVERTLNMAEGCLLLVDAQEGVMPQTRFVLKKALELNLKPIVVINKIDKRFAKPQKTLNKIQDLFLNLVTDADQLDFKVFYAVGQSGKVFKKLPKEKGKNLENVNTDTKPLLNEIINSIPAPSGNPDAPFQMQVSSIDFDPHYGRYLIGKVKEGQIQVENEVITISPSEATTKDSTETIAKDSTKTAPKATKNPSEKSNRTIQPHKQKLHTQKGKISRICIKHGLQYQDVDVAQTGEIVAIAGLENVAIGDTICSPQKVEALPAIKISPPSLKIKFEANTSPFLGREGKFVNIKQIQKRLDREAEMNVSLKINKNSDGSYYVSGRGELHLGILIETLRREGYEFQVRKPEVIITEINGKKMEPLEQLYIEIPEKYFSVISQAVNKRSGVLTSIQTENQSSKLTYEILTRNLLGLRRNLLIATKGNLIMHTSFLKLTDWRGEIEPIKKGRLVSTATGKTLAYALNSIQDRGILFVEPNTDVYEGMIIGNNKYEKDIEVNPTKARKKTNVRQARGVITLINLNAARQLTLEEAISTLGQDEILEVTPTNLRLRRQFLTKLQKYNETKKS